MIQHTSLYKKDSLGNIRVWHIEQDEDKYRMVSGVHGGARVATEWTIAEPKNVGRANETTGWEQAELEIESAYTKKLEQQGYFTNIEDAKSRKLEFFEPMLAKKYEDEASKLWTNGEYHQGYLFAQPKLDGIRCMATGVRLHTRKGKDIPSCAHILESLRHLPEGVILDGELYNHDLKDNFNEIASLVRKTKGWEKERDRIAETIQYWVYDAFFEDDPGLLFEQRINKAFKLLHPVLTDESPVRFVRTESAVRETQLDLHYLQTLESGFEGQMVRLNTPYENKRSKHLLKRKEFQDEEFVILDVLEGIGNRSGMAGSLLLDLGDGRTFQSGIKGGRDHYRYLLSKKEQFIGKPATIRFFHRTPDGIPRFPVCVDVDRTDI